MKQKNMILLGVAAVCGLIAAVLTSRLGAGSAPVQEMVQVIVAKTELPVGTLLEEKDFNAILDRKPFPAAAVPPDVINDPELLKGKRVSRTMRVGNFFAPADVSNKGDVTLPTGRSQFAVPLNAVRAVAGFVQPGSIVDVLALIKLSGTKREGDMSRDKGAIILLRNMLVVAVNTVDRRQEGLAAQNQVESVSLAVTESQGKLLHLFNSMGGDLTLMLKGPGDKVDTNDEKAQEGEVTYESLSNPKKDPEAAAPIAPLPPETVDVAVAKADMEANTEITAENFSQYFELRSMVKEGVPENSLNGPQDVRNREYLKVPVVKGQLMMRSHLSLDAAVKPQPKDPKLSHTLTITNGANSSTTTYEGKDAGDLRRVEVPSAGTQEVAPAQKPMPQEQPKPTERADPRSRAL